MNPSPRWHSVRKAQDVLRLGPGPWICYKCGETDPACLQVHHYLTRKRDAKRVVLICHNCHDKEERKLSRRQLRGRREPAPRARALARIECLEILIKDFPDVLAECRRDLGAHK